MKWRFWQKTKTVTEPAECVHDWTNWTDPVTTTTRVIAGLFSTDTMDRECWMQSRRCLRCNLAERKYV